jgi:hypothetical protein
MAVTKRDKEGNIWSDDSGAMKIIGRTDGQGYNWVSQMDGTYKRATPFQDKMISAGSSPVPSSKYQSGYSTVPLGERKMEEVANQKKLDMERVLALRGPAAEQRAAEAEAMPLYKKLLPILGDEFKSIYHGSKDIAADTKMLNDNLALEKPYLFKPRDQMVIKEDRDQTDIRQQKRAFEKDMFRELDESTTFGQIARMPPYLASGRLLGKPLEEGIASGLSKYKKLAHGDKALGINATGRKPFVPEVISDALLGAAEGAVSEDETATDGMLSSLFGSTLGRSIAPKVERAAINNSKYDTGLVEEFVNKGYMASPGMRTGNINMQELDSRQSKKPTNKNWYDVKDANNRRVLLNEVLDASGLGDVGLDLKKLEGLAPDRLSKVVKSMKEEYNQLEDISNGFIKPDSFNQIASRAMDLLPQLPRNLQNQLKADLKLINPEGGFMELPSSFRGENYKMNQKIFKNSRTDASKQSASLAELYDDISNMYKEGLELGMGPQVSKKWNDLNERWALSSMIRENAFDVNNVFDGKKLLNHIASNDMSRITIGQGGDRIKKLHDITRMTDIENKQSSVDFGEGLAGLTDAEKKAQESRNKGLLKFPDIGDTPRIDNMLLNKQYSGYVGGPLMIEGLLNLPRDSTSRIFRALEQGGDTKMGLLNFTMSDEERERRKKEAEERIKNGGTYFGVIPNN